MKRTSIVLIILTLFIAMCGISTIQAEEKVKRPYKVVFMTTPFGSPGYDVGAAFEQVFAKAGSWVNIKHQETPGAVYIITHVLKNREKMIAGEIPFILAGSSNTVQPFVIEGRKPFEAMKIPTDRALVSAPTFITFFGTFDPDIKDLKDFTGKRVGTAERARLFSGMLADAPLFAKGVGNWKEIKWSQLGSAGCKDAILNRKLDATKLNFLGKIKVNEKGEYICTAAAPDPATMELMSAGRKLHLVPIKKAYILKGYDHSKDMAIVPCLVKKGAIKGLDRDIEALAAIGVITCDAALPVEVAEEIVRVRHEFREEFGKYHAALKFFPTTPYPIGTFRKEWVHPGVLKAMEKMSLPIPKTSGE